MSNPNLDIEFIYSSINRYYNAKVAAARPLPKKVFETIDELGKHLTAFKGEQAIDFPKHFTWATRASEALWLFREYAFCLLMLHLGNILSDSSTWRSKIHRKIPDDMNIKENRFTVIGSQMISSDIDVTVQGAHTAVIIAILEDMFVILTNKYGIPFLQMDIQFYGDFRILSKLYVNVGLFSDEQRCEMLKYAYISYFRSLEMTRTYTVSPLARRLGYIYLKRLDVSRSLKSILEEAFAEWTHTAPNGQLDRERFYLEQERAEREASLLRGYNKDTRLLANDIFFSIARGDIHRAESYVLPSTAVHIVEIEQVLGDASQERCTIDKKWFADNACIGIDSFAYIASAIEQCGYLEHYHPGKAVCIKKGVKYFGRMVRGLLHTGLLDSTFSPIYDKLNRFRKSEEGVCPYNIHALLEKIQKALRPQVRKTRRA
jgi:hypothetical protein